MRMMSSLAFSTQPMTYKLINSRSAPVAARHTFLQWSISVAASRSRLEPYTLMASTLQQSRNASQQLYNSQKNKSSKHDDP